MLLLDKVIETSVNVDDPTNFCADFDRHLLASIRASYEGRCFMGSFIVKIEKVLASSRCRIVTTSPSDGVVDVRFLASVVVFGKWDILVGAEIVTLQPFVNAHFKTETVKGPVDVAVSVVSLPPSETLSIGQKISVRVRDARYQPYNQRANVVGVMLTCDLAAPVFSVKGSISPTIRDPTAAILGAIDEELKLRAGLSGEKKARLWQFEALLNTYKSDEKDLKTKKADTESPKSSGTKDDLWDGPASLAPAYSNVETVNLLPIARRIAAGETLEFGGVWTRPLGMCRSSPMALKARPEDVPAAWPAAAEQQAGPMLLFMLKNIYDFLAATRRLAEVFELPAVFDKHRNLWNMMRSTQKPLPR